MNIDFDYVSLRGTTFNIGNVTYKIAGCGSGAWDHIAITLWYNQKLMTIKFPSDYLTSFANNGKEALINEIKRETIVKLGYNPRLMESKLWKLFYD